jgi:hypothetical protein
MDLTASSSEFTLFASLCRIFSIVFVSISNELSYFRSFSFFHWSKPSPVPFRFTFKRFLILGFLIWFLPTIIVWNHLGFYLDDILFPRWRETKINKPLFIVGNARSGTSWFHKLIYQSDPNIFTSFQTWEIIFATSITWKYLFYFLFAFDFYCCFGVNYYLLKCLDHKLFQNIQKFHKFSLFHIEEDEWLMIHIGYSQLILFFFPLATDYLQSLIYFDYYPSLFQLLPSKDAEVTVATTLSESKKEKILSALRTTQKEMLSYKVRYQIFQYYKECIQRHLYYHQHTFRGQPIPAAMPKVFLSKNPTFTLRLSTLTGIFPDAEILVLVRNPVESIPSMISYIGRIWSTLNSPIDVYPNAEQLLSFCEIHYLFPILMKQSFLLNPEQIQFFSYDCLKKKKGHLVKELFPLFLKISESRREADSTKKTMEFDEEKWIIQMKNYLSLEELHLVRYSSPHQYSWKDCCPSLTQEQVNKY